MRGMAVAVHLFVVSILGGGIGPWVVGMLNDSFRSSYGEMGIRYSLVIIQSVGLVLATGCYLLVAHSYRQDVERALREEGADP